VILGVHARTRGVHPAVVWGARRLGERVGRARQCYPSRNRALPPDPSCGTRLGNGALVKEAAVSAPVGVSGEESSGGKEKGMTREPRRSATQLVWWC
jgi:hypothetical protein